MLWLLPTCSIRTCLSPRVVVQHSSHSFKWPHSCNSSLHWCISTSSPYFLLLCFVLLFSGSARKTRDYSTMDHIFQRSSYFSGHILWIPVWDLVAVLSENSKPRHLETSGHLVPWFPSKRNSTMTPFPYTSVLALPSSWILLLGINRQKTSDQFLNILPLPVRGLQVIAIIIFLRINTVIDEVPVPQKACSFAYWSLMSMQLLDLGGPYFPPTLGDIIYFNQTKSSGTPFLLLLETPQMQEMYLKMHVLYCVYGSI